MYQDTLKSCELLLCAQILKPVIYKCVQLYHAIV